MFSNIGKKIKILAKVLCWVGIVCSVLMGAALIARGGDTIMTVNGEYRTAPTLLLGILIIIIGSLLSWISSFFTYGFGQLIENTDQIRENTSRE